MPKFSGVQSTLHAGQFFMLLLSSADFFKNLLFQNILLGKLSECQTVWIQTVCKDHQQATKFNEGES